MQAWLLNMKKLKLLESKIIFSHLLYQFYEVKWELFFVPHKVWREAVIAPAISDLEKVYDDQNFKLKRENTMTHK